MKYIYILMLLCLAPLFSARAKQVDTNCDCDRCTFSDFRSALGVCVRPLSSGET